MIRRIHLTPWLGFALSSLVLSILPNVHADEAIMQAVSATYKVRNPESNATSFLISRTVDGDAAEIILVTAAHVVERMKGDHCELVLREERLDGTFAKRSIQLQVRKGGMPMWTRHPKSDVAAIKIVVPDAFRSKAIPYDQILDSSNCTDCRLEMGQSLWVLCYPAQLASSRSGFPVLRRGTVASYPLVETEQSRRFLLDYSTFGGDSGGPVFAVNNKSGNAKAQIVGLIHGQHRETTKSMTPNEERTVHRPLGLAIVVHAKFIRETIEMLKSNK